MLIRKLIIIFSITSAIIYFFQWMGYTGWIHEKIWLSQAFLFCTFLIAIRINQIGLQRSPKQFHIFYFSSMFIRMFLSFGFMIFIALTIKNQIVILLSNFIVMYLLYSWFEIYLLIHNLRPDLKKGDAKS